MIKITSNIQGISVQKVVLLPVLMVAWEPFMVGIDPDTPGTYINAGLKKAMIGTSFHFYRPLDVKLHLINRNNITRYLEGHGEP